MYRRAFVCVVSLVVSLRRSLFAVSRILLVTLGFAVQDPIQRLRYSVNGAMDAGAQCSS